MLHTLNCYPWDGIAICRLSIFFNSRNCQLQSSCRLRNLESESELCSHCDVHPFFTAGRYRHSSFFLSASVGSDPSVWRVSSMLFSFSGLVHEGTLVHAVSVLWQWSNRLTVEAPMALLDWFKKAFTLKTSTSPVRLAYLQAMLGAFKGRS